MNEENPASRPEDPPAVSIPAERPPAPASRKKRKSYGQWIGIASLVAVIALIASTVKPGQGPLVYSKYVDEVTTHQARFVGQELRVEGMVQAGSLQHPDGTSDYRFRIERYDQSMPVRYSGVVADTFREGIGVTVRGRLQADGSLDAQELVVKCPSRYEMQAAQQHGAHMPPGMIPGANHANP